jgi:hypothetical protein
MAPGNAEFILCEGCKAQIGAWRSVCPECGFDRKTGNVDPEARARPVASAHPEPEPAPAWSPWLAALVSLGVVASALRYLTPELSGTLSLVVVTAWVAFFVHKR